MSTLATDSGRKNAAHLAGGAILACQSDERLVALFREGHERAFETIVSRYRPALVRFCGRILPESRTEDAAQQTFINAHAALLATDEPPAQLRPWLYTIARNASLNMLRQNGWSYEQIPLDFDGVRRPDQVVEQRIQLQNTVAAVNDLPDRQRNALVMREFEGRTYEEIALALGTGDGAVRQLLNRARGALRAAASAVMPPPVVERAAATMQQADGRRLAEVLGGMGAAGVAKAGATALVAGSLVVGAVSGPLPLLDSAHRSTHRAVTRHARGASASAARKAGAAPTLGPRSAGSGQGAHGEHGRSNGHDEGRGSGASRRASHHGSSNESRRSGSGERRSGTGAHRPGSTDHRSGGETNRSGSGETSHSGSGGTGGSHDGSGTSGTDDRLSGTSGSGTSGSGELVTSTSTDGASSGSGSSGESSSTTSGSGTSGSSDGGSSGTSGISGSTNTTSGSSGSGSTTTTSSSGG